MGSNQEKAGPKKPQYISVVWVVLALVLVMLPLAAIGKLMSVSDEELDDVVGQSLLEFSVINRVVTTPGGTKTFTPIIIKVNAVVVINNVHMDNVRMGYWVGVWDMHIDNGQGLTWGGAGYPVYMRGLRIELVYDNIYSSSPRFQYLRIGTDDFSGCLDAASVTGDSPSSLLRLSYDGTVHANQLGVTISDQMNNATDCDSGILGVRIPMTNVLRMYFHCGPSDEGRTDWFITLADNISDGYGNNNSVAWNPGSTVGEHVPGRGYWMHFQNTYVGATLW